MKSFVRVVAVCLLLMVAGVGPSWAAEPTINFPTSADTDAWLTNQINRWYGATVDQKMATLNEELTDSETGVDLVAVPSHWPSSGFYIQIHSEYMYVEGTSGVTLTVTRGVGGVNASTHATGATVYFVTTAETFEHMKDSIQAIQNALLNGTLAGIFTTLSSGAAGFSVDADGDAIAKSLTVTKTNGVAGSTLWPEANSNDTDGVGFMGPASATRKLYFQFENGDPAAGEVMQLGTPALVGSDYVSQITYGSTSGGDVTSVGDCTDGACFDGTSDGGTYIRLYDESGFYAEILGNAVTLTANRQFTLPNSGGNISILGQTITDTEMAAADFGDFTCTGSDDGCTIDSGAFALSELAGGAAGANAYDFGGATSVELPNGNNPTTDAAGEVAVDVNNYALEVFAATASRLIPTVFTKELTIPEPDKQQLILDAWPIFRVDATAFPFGITVTSCQVTLSADAAYVAVFEEWTGDPPAQTADIETVTTGAGDSYMEDTTPANPTIEADNYVYVDLPTTDVPMVQVQISYTVNEGN